MNILILSFFAVALASTDTQKTLVKPDVAAAPAEKTSTPQSTDPLKNAETKSNDKISELPTGTADARTQRTLNSLAEQAGWFPDLKITVLNGMVTIKGKTKNIAHLEWLAKTADRLPTVIAVINQAEIEQAPVTDFTPALTEFRSMIEKAKKALPTTALALLMLGIFLALGSQISKLVRRVWARSISNVFLHSTVSKLTMLPIWVLFFYLALQIAGYSSLATTIIGGTGALGLVLGFAFKDIAGNYLSGILLAIRSPFTKGDEIQVGGYEGYVQNLNMRGTTIVDYDGNLVLIPNSIVTQSVIRNKTVNPKTRTAFAIGISYKDSIDEAQELIRTSLLAIPDILQDPEPMIAAEAFSDTSVRLTITFWYDSSKSSVTKTKSAAIIQSRDALIKGGFTLPDRSYEVRMLDAAEFQKSNEGVKSNTPTAPEKTDLSHENEAKRLGEGADIMRRSSPELVKT